MPPRSRRPCTVPGCRGTIEAGSRDGKLVEWCQVCERRILQLQQRNRQVVELEARLAAPPASGPLSDAALLELAPQRLSNVRHAIRLTRRSSNAVSHALRQGEIAHVRIGRLTLVSLESAKRWAESYTRRTPAGKRTAAIVAVLPREASHALTLQEISAAAQISVGNAQQWVTAQRGGVGLQRVPAIGKSGRAILRYWWQEGEAPHA